MKQFQVRRAIWAAMSTKHNMTHTKEVYYRCQSAIHFGLREQIVSQIVNPLSTLTIDEH